MKQFLIAEDRGVLRIAGEDRASFLQGIISNDVTKATDQRALWSAFLTPQGKYLHDFFMIEQEGAYLLDCETARLADLKRRLSLYRLRAKVEIEDVSDAFAVALLFGDGSVAALALSEEPGAAKALAGGVVFVDPRLSAMGLRALLPRQDASQILESAGFEVGTREDYDERRLSLGLPDGSRDLEIEKSILLEAGFDELGGVDWDKGCFMGQELTARTKYRALIKKRLLPVTFEGAPPEPGTIIRRGEREAGELRSVVGQRGLALIRLAQIPDAKSDDVLTAGDTRVSVETPDWVKFQNAD